MSVTIQAELSVARLRQEHHMGAGMAIAFDSLGYARHLRERGVPPEQAEAHADAART
jgi:hypothetical protein